MTIVTNFTPLGGPKKKLPSGTVLFDSGNPGSYIVTIPYTQYYWVDVRGASGGYASIVYLAVSTIQDGGRGGRVYGTTLLEKGTYGINVGAGGVNSGAPVLNFLVSGGNGGYSNIEGVAYSAGGTGGQAMLGLIGSNYYWAVAQRGSDGGCETYGRAGLTGVTGGSEFGNQENGHVWLIAQ